MRLQVVGGMCNRLRAIFDWKIRLGAEPLTVVWLPDHYVSHARFSDVFAPLPGIEFTEVGPVDHVALDELKPDESWMRLYRDLMPTYGLQARIAECMQKLPPFYAAMHVRTGDHAKLSVRQGWPTVTQGERFNWIREQPGPVFIACDNAIEQLSWARCEHVVAERLTRGGIEQDIEDHRRHTTLQHAVVDLFVCAGAKHFLGTPGSSFSETIDILRWLNGLRETPPELVSLT